jgi:hypothetical protein
MRLQHVSIGPVQPREENQVLPRPDEMQRFRKLRVDLQDGLRRAFEGLVRRRPGSWRPERTKPIARTEKLAPTYLSAAANACAITP